MTAVLKSHCYCEVASLDSPYCFTCSDCHRNFHQECLRSSAPSNLKGDWLFQFKCERCGVGEEDFRRIKLQWTQVVQLALYNLQLNEAGMCGYFRWKEHICVFIDRHWALFFGSHRKKTSLWHGTVAGVLSSGCPAIFTSGGQELKESGWWRLAEMKPPFIQKHGTPTTRTVVKKKEPAPGHVEPPKEGLRCRRGGSSIQAAMELKAKRSTLMEAKEIRKTMVSKSSSDPHSTPVCASSLLSAHLQSGVPLQPNVVSPVHTATQSSTSPPDTKPLAFTGLFSTPDNMKPDGSRPDVPESSSAGSLLAEHLTTVNLRAHALSSGTLVPSNPPDLSDENSEMSQSSYLTEKDLKLQDTLPNLLMSDDLAVDNSDSDLEIDPGTISPPPPGRGIRMRESPTIEELLSTMDSESSYQQLSQDSNQDYSINQDSSMSFDTSNQGSISMDTSYPGSASLHSNSCQGSFSVLSNISNIEMENKPAKEKNDEDCSVVDSESDSQSESEDSDSSDRQPGLNADGTVATNTPTAIVKKEEIVVPEISYTLMSTYEERQLLRKLDSFSKHGQLPTHVNRLRRKLLVRQHKREHGLSLFDLDAQLNKLAQKCWGIQYGIRNTQGYKYNSGQTTGDNRVLDKYQIATMIAKSQQLHQPSFLNRLVGTEDDQLQCICSPYTARVLKPFIRRDHESCPLKMRLLQEIKAYPHRNDPTWTAEPPPPIDYCYLRPQHIPSVNTLCREFFWPGIDLSECLQYPDFSCVVLYRKFVIGFAFMVPDAKQNEAYISFIFTHPEWRRAGVATFMLYHLIQTCMGKDVTLHVSATNSAMLLYQRFGFKPEEFILDFYDKYYPPDVKDCKHAFFLRLRR